MDALIVSIIAVFSFVFGVVLGYREWEHRKKLNNQQHEYLDGLKLWEKEKGAKKHDDKV